MTDVRGCDEAGVMALIKREHQWRTDLTDLETRVAEAATLLRRSRMECDFDRLKSVHARVLSLLEHV